MESSPDEAQQKIHRFLIPPFFESNKKYPAREKVPSVLKINNMVYNVSTAGGENFFILLYLFVFFVTENDAFRMDLLI